MNERRQAGLGCYGVQAGSGWQRTGAGTGRDDTRMDGIFNSTYNNSQASTRLSISLFLSATSLCPLHLTDGRQQMER
jgi:hypothetical protein